MVAIILQGCCADNGRRPADGLTGPGGVFQELPHRYDIKHRLQRDRQRVPRAGLPTRGQRRKCRFSAVPHPVTRDGRIESVLQTRATQQARRDRGTQQQRFPVLLTKGSCCLLVSELSRVYD